MDGTGIIESSAWTHHIQKAFSENLTLNARCLALIQRALSARTYALELSAWSEKSTERIRMRRLGAICAIARKRRMLTRCHGCSDRITRWTYAFYLVASMNFRVRVISVYFAKARVNRIKIKMEPSFTQRVRATLACLKRLLLHTCLFSIPPNSSHT